MVVFALYMRGIRESYVFSILTSDVDSDSDQMVARLSVVNRQNAISVSLVSYRSITGIISSPIVLWI